MHVNAGTMHNQLPCTLLVLWPGKEQQNQLWFLKSLPATCAASLKHGSALLQKDILSRQLSTVCGWYWQSSPLFPTVMNVTHLKAAFICKVTSHICHPDLQLWQHCTCGTINGDWTLHSQLPAGPSFQHKVHGIRLEPGPPFKTALIPDCQLDIAWLPRDAHFGNKHIFMCLQAAAMHGETRAYRINSMGLFSL